MKNYLSIVFAAVAVAFVSCSKESAKDITPEPINPVKETITFSASIDLDADTKASLSDHAIHWVDGDVIALANDVNDDIESCAVFPDGTDPTKCTFTATAVGGATTYYAVCIGNSITGISFDHSTAIFTGLNNPKHTFSKNSVTGSSLAMAGKSTDKSSISFSPCLALMKIKIASESVAAKYAGGYSGIRGFNLIIKHSGSRIHPSGDYSINLSAGEMSVSYIDNEKGADFIQVSEGDNLMDSSASYYLAVLPAGDVETFQFQPFGFDSSENAKWNTIYPMTLSSATSINSGDYFDLGTINPLGLQKARDAFVPAITLDGSFSDWSSIASFPGDAGNKILEWKATSDKQNIYFYFKLDESVVKANGKWEAVIMTAFDTDNNTETGANADYNMGGGFEARSKAIPFNHSAGSDVVFYSPASPSSSSQIKCPISGDSIGTVATAGISDGTYDYVEIRIPRNKIGSPASGSTIRIRQALGWLAYCDAQTLVLD